jgi:ANTAR domain
VPERLDRVRAETGEGPALDVLETNDLVISGDVAADPRWPAFGARVLKELNVRSVAAYRLHLGRDHRAALIFVSDWPYAFDELTGAIGAIFAAYCSLVLLTEEILGDGLTSSRAAEVHREIGVAVGILLADGELTTDEAYRRLRSASRTLTTSLPDVARHVIAYRSLPE